MAVNPSNGNLYVSNTEARNEVRFEGPGTFGGSTVQGHLAESRVTVISGASVLPRHLNKHIDYAIRPAPPGTKDHSLATPVEMAVSGDGATLYVAAFGSGRIGVFDTAALEADTFDPTLTSADYIDVSGGGPGGIVLDEARNRLFVYTRFDNGVSILDTATGTENAHFVLPNPEPDHVVDGRPFLYDAQLTSSNGEASCASCHIFGDLDSLAWDLGNPDDEVTQSPIPIRLETAFNLNGFSPPINGTGNLEDFHPMKGPMTTQTLRGMVNHGAMHWRGDRAVPEPVPADPFDSEQAFKNFNVAFPGLVGRSAELSAGEMQAFTDFALAITLPPNPIRDLSNALSSTQLPGRNVSLGKDFFDGNDGPDSGGGHRSDGVPFIDDAGFTCEGCHVLNPGAGHFGTDGEQSFENETQTQKIPHLRNLYQKLGMFGMIGVDFFLGGDNGHKGDQIRGFGYLHDGSVDTVFRFFRADVFAHQDFFVTSVGFEDGAAGDTQRRDIEAFMLAFDSDLAPIVGQQVSLSAGGDGSALGRVGLMIARAGTSFTSQILGPGANECDLIVKAVVDGEARGYLYDPVAATFESDRAADAPLTDAALRGLIPASTATLNYTCAPPGSGVRMGIDRDLDGFLDRDELDAETDPTNAGSAPAACNDGLDNDGDGDIDLADAGCNNDPAWDVENPACSNGVNDDNDGLVDGADPHCAGKPHRKRETPKSSCGLGAELILVLPPLLWWRGRRRR